MYPIRDAGPWKVSFRRDSDTNVESVTERTTRRYEKIPSNGWVVLVTRHAGSMSKGKRRYLIIIPSLLGERVVPETVHLDVAVDVQLLIGQLLGAENGVQDVLVVGETAACAITLLLALGFGRGSHRCATR